MEALFSEEGVVWYGVVLRWVGAPWYEFAGGGGVGREVPGEVVGDVSSVEDRFVTSRVVKVGWREGWVCRCLDRQSGGVGCCCCWVGDGTSSQTKGNVDFRMFLVCNINRASVRSRW